MTIEPNTFDLDKPRVQGRTLLPPKRHTPKQVSKLTYLESKTRLADICGIKDCIMDGGFHGTPMCEEHAWQVWATLTAVKEYDDEREAARNNLAQYEARMAEEDRKKREEREASWKTDRWIAPGWVYYLQVGDRIKIGFTKNIDQRMKQYPPHSVFLAAHPGTPKVEREMHHKFLHLLANGREWFTVSHDLIAHIETMRNDFKQPHLAA